MTTLTIDGRKYIAIPMDRWATIPRKVRNLINHENREQFRTPNGDYKAIPALRASIARDIIRARKALGWSQRKLAGEAHIRQATLVSVESGRKTPNVRTVEKIEAALQRASSHNR
jgi:ribosome-binding protein aMBF1 (putative translation factor)